MRTKKFAALVCACAIALNCAAPILANTPTSFADAALKLPAAPEPVTFSPRETDECLAVAADDSTDGTNDGSARKSGNSFVHVLAAPFRAIARWFGGGKKDSRPSDAAKTKRETKTTSEVASAPTAAQKKDRDQEKTHDKSVNNSAPERAANVAPAPTVPAPTLATMLPQAVTPSQTTLAASPPPASPSQTTAATLPTTAPPSAVTSESPVAPQTSAPFTPLVVGVPRDAISQGRALLERGYTSEAISELSVAAATGSNLLEANNLLGLAYDRRGMHKEAQSFYERALSVAPTDAHVINNLGYSLYLDDHYKEALAKLKLAARLDPASPEIFNNLGFVYGRLAKFDDAFRNFARAGGDLYARFQTGMLLEAAGRDRDAIKQYEAARRIEPAATDVLRRLITLYNRTGQREKAEAAERALDQPKNKATSSSG